jgi:hypothetical protein
MSLTHPCILLLTAETPYLVKDRKKETEIGDTLEAILSRARKGKLFDGKRVYITKGVSPSIATMQKIVSASGGIVSFSCLLPHFT